MFSGSAGAGVLDSKLYSGNPKSKCSPAQIKQALRQPHSSSNHAESGQPMVLAKPAIKVMPVIAPRDRWPYKCTSVAKAASYKPAAMATPRMLQATNIPTGPCASAKAINPSAKTKLLSIKTGLPP